MSAHVMYRGVCARTGEVSSIAVGAMAVITFTADVDFPVDLTAWCVCAHVLCMCMSPQCR